MHVLDGIEVKKNLTAWMVNQEGYECEQSIHQVLGSHWLWSLCRLQGLLGVAHLQGREEGTNCLSGGG